MIDASICVPSIPVCPPLQASALDGAMSAIKTRLPDDEDILKGPFLLSE